MPALLTPDEVAEELKRPRKWVVEAAHDGRLPGTKVGGVWRFRRDVLDRWLEAQTSDRRKRSPEAQRKRGGKA